MLTTTHDTKTVHELVTLYTKRRLNLSPAFQRLSVWRPQARRLLIHSLLDGIPIPSIFLYHRVGRGGSPVYDVIDGKQRIETILLFLGKGPLAETEELWIRRSYPEDSPADWWLWEHLNKATRNRLLTAKLPVIEVEGEFSEIVDLFVRINSTGTSLSGQERRNARYFTSPVLKTAQKVAEALKPNLKRLGVLSESQFQRMKHVELTTELLIAIAKGGHPNKKAKIDEVIRGEGVEAEHLTDAARHLRRSVKLTTAILPDLKTTRFRQLADFYSLVTLVNTLRDEGMSITTHNSSKNTLAGALLRDFGRGVDEVAEQVRRGRGATTRQEPYRNYLMTVREATDTATQRKAREKILREVLDGVFDSLDTTRNFNQVQRRILWHASSKKRCSICGDRIARWEDVSVDHVSPHILGGRTNLSNAALAHKPCNASKGARPRRSSSRRSGRPSARRRTSRRSSRTRRT